MFDWIRLFGFPSNQLKDSFLLYKRVTEQYNNPEILKKVRSLIPTDIVLKIISTKKDEEQYNNVVPLLKWFKKEFMKWTPTEPVCEKCISNKSDRLSSSSSLRSTTATVATIPRMQLKEIREGNSWKMRSVEIFVCRSCNYEFAFPRYGEILNIVETKTGRCSEWSILFGAMLSSLGIKTRIVHDFLNHCWNEVMFSSSSYSFSSSSEKGRWVHIDSTLDYPISLNHSKYYEQNWNKEYQYVLAFTADEVEDVTKTYTIKWETILKRRLKGKNNSIDFSKLYTTI
ncbi:MAG: transglutaminase-like domain-containing protein [Candidatus Nitrosocosmicus sp.]